MAPYLLFGFLCAGILHAFFSTEKITQHLGKRSMSSVFKAALYGIPLPLCSCGVIPAALSLREKGASRSSILSFLITTPTTGLDSIMATYALLGPFFAVFRVITSFLCGITAGLVFMLSSVPASPPVVKEEKCPHCHETSKHQHGWKDKIKTMLHYSTVELMGDISRWLLLGILIGGAINWLVPDTFVQRYLGSAWQSMLVMLIVGIPLYICATGSIPIAAALMLKGMSPGAALVFLIAGPATNTVSITLINRFMGRAATAIYLLSTAIGSIIMGLVLNILWTNISAERMFHGLHRELLPPWLHLVSSLLLVGMMINASVFKRRKPC